MSFPVMDRDEINKELDSIKADTKNYIFEVYPNLSEYKRDLMGKMINCALDVNINLFLSINDVYFHKGVKDVMILRLNNRERYLNNLLALDSEPSVTKDLLFDFERVVNDYAGIVDLLTSECVDIESNNYDTAEVNRLTFELESDFYSKDFYQEFMNIFLELTNNVCFMPVDKFGDFDEFLKTVNDSIVLNRSGKIDSIIIGNSIFNKVNNPNDYLDVYIKELKSCSNEIKALYGKIGILEGKDYDYFSMSGHDLKVSVDCLKKIDNSYVAGKINYLS